jgi:hypothetical protein
MTRVVVAMDPAVTSGDEADVRDLLRARFALHKLI